MVVILMSFSVGWMDCVFFCGGVVMGILIVWILVMRRVVRE